MFVPVGDSPAADADRILDMVVRTMLVPGSLADMGYRGCAALLLSPLHAEVLPAADIRRLHGHVRGAPSTPDDETVHGLSSPHHLLIAVAGGAGTYSAVLRGLADGVGNIVTMPIT